MNFLKLPNALMIRSQDGRSKTIQKDFPKYGEILTALEQGKYKAVERILWYTEDTAKETQIFTVENGVVEIKHEDVTPAFITKRLEQHMVDGVSLKPLEAFWNKLKQNPHVENRETLLLFLEKNKCILTDSGDFIAFKALREDYTDCYSGKLDMSIGQSRDWNKDFPDVPIEYAFDGDCHHTAYHVGSRNYAASFYEGKGKLVEVLVNPIDVVYVPAGSTGHKIRVSKFLVIGDCTYKSDTQIPLVASPEDMCGDCSRVIDECTCDECDGCYHPIHECICNEIDEDEEDFDDEEEDDDYCDECGMIYYSCLCSHEDEG